MNDSEKQTIVFIPRNFIEKGTFMGGMFKIRNAIEGGILAVLIAVPVIQLPLSLTIRIIILCMTALPAAMISLIGIGGESISAFLMNALRFLKNRRVIYRIDVNPDPKNKHRIKKPRNKEPKAKKHKHPKKKSTASMTASGQSDEYEGCVSDEISSHDVAISKKKERRQFDTSTKRGIRKQAREDIRILKYENRQLKKAQKQAKRAVRTELKRQKQEEKRRVREEKRQKKAEIKATKQADAKGHKKLYINESGQIYIQNGDTPEIKDHFDYFPPRNYWDVLITLFQKEDLTAKETDQALELSWIKE